MEAPERFKVEATCRELKSRVVVALSLELNSLWKPAQVEVELKAEFQAVVKPVPVKEELTTRVSMKEEVALREPVILKLLSMVEDPLKNRPAAVLVGESVLVKICWKEPFCPDTPQAPPVPETRPLVSTERHWVDPVREERVRLELILRVSLKVEEA